MNDASSPPKWIPAVFGFFAFLMGTLVLGAVLGIVPADPHGFLAPRWVVGAIGVGLILLAFMFWIPTSTPSLVKAVMGWTAMLLWAVVCNWTAFARGVRYTSSLSAGPVSVEGNDQFGGRIVFGLVALVIDGLLAWSLVTQIRRRLRAR
jgi:hypothetical protein